MSSDSPLFQIPYVVHNPTSWGPPLNEIDDRSSASSGDAASVGCAKFIDLPYAPFGRSDRLGRVADFINPNNVNRGGGGYGYNRTRMETPKNEETAANEDEDGAFQLVDTSKTTSATHHSSQMKRFVNPALKRKQHSIRLRQINARRQQSAGGSAMPGVAGGLDHRMSSARGGGRFGNAGGRGALGGRGGSGPGGYYNNRIDRQPSVAVQSDWKLLEDIDLSKMTKHLTASMAVPKVTDVLWCGFLDPYNDVYDKVTARQPVPLKRMDHKEFYPVTTTDDPVLEKLAIDGAGQIFITDTILSHLMTCTRSVYPWDIVIQKLPGNILFFDKRDNSTFDFLTVQETAYAQPPPMDDESGINTPERLGLEATMINQNFSQQILKKTGRQEMDLPNPFYDEEESSSKTEPASTAFRYRSFELEPNVKVVCRTELHGLVKKTQYMTAFCLNEYAPASSAASGPAPQLINWREKIDSQRGAVLANELKNNSFKLAKWTAQSILAGADQMKIGFVSRANPKNANEHVILATQFYRPMDFAQQITLQEGQMWCMFRTFIALILKQPEESGKYVLMRDPNKPLMHLYKVPPDAFEDAE